MQLAFPAPKTFIIGIEIYYLQHSKKEHTALVSEEYSEERSLSSVEVVELCGQTGRLWLVMQVIGHLSGFQRLRKKLE